MIAKSQVRALVLHIAAFSVTVVLLELRVAFGCLRLTIFAKLIVISWSICLFGLREFSFANSGRNSVYLGPTCYLHLRFSLHSMALSFLPPLLLPFEEAPLSFETLVEGWLETASL